MADDSMTVLDVLRKEELPGGDFLREGGFVHELMDAEVTALVGAEPYQRSEERTGQRNGHRSRRWDTRVVYSVWRKQVSVVHASGACIPHSMPQTTPRPPPHYRLGPPFVQTQAPKHFLRNVS